MIEKKILIEIINILFVLREQSVKDILKFKKKVPIVDRYFHRNFSKIKFSANAIDWAMKNPNYDFASLSPKIKENFTNKEVYQYLIEINKIIDLINKSLVEIINIYFTLTKQDIENISIYNKKFMDKVKKTTLSYVAINFSIKNPNYNFISLSSHIKERLTNEEIYNYLNKIEEAIYMGTNLMTLLYESMYMSFEKFNNLSANHKTVEAFYDYFTENEHRNNLCQSAKEAIKHPKYNFNAFYPMSKKRFTNKEIYKFLCKISDICTSINTEKRYK